MTSLHAIPATIAAPGSTQNPRVVRWMYAGLGLSCVGLGGVGVAVPGMPTTIFLILASYFLTRSCPLLERKIMQSRLFRPYAKYLDGSAPMPMRAKLISIALMWISVSISCIFILRSEAPVFVAPLTVVLAIVGTWFILRWRPRLAG
jgi:hypothetical protein